MILKKGWIMEISPIGYKGSFCSLIQLNKIMDVF